MPCKNYNGPYVTFYMETATSSTICEIGSCWICPQKKCNNGWPWCNSFVQVLIYLDIYINRVISGPSHISLYTSYRGVLSLKKKKIFPGEFFTNCASPKPTWNFHALDFISPHILLERGYSHSKSDYSQLCITKNPLQIFFLHEIANIQGANSQ